MFGQRATRWPRGLANKAAKIYYIRYANKFLRIEAKAEEFLYSASFSFGCCFYSTWSFLKWRCTLCPFIWYARHVVCQKSPHCDKSFFSQLFVSFTSRTLCLMFKITDGLHTVRSTMHISRCTVYTYIHIHIYSMYVYICVFICT